VGAETTGLAAGRLTAPAGTEAAATTSDVTCWPGGQVDGQEQQARDVHAVRDSVTGVKGHIAKGIDAVRTVMTKRLR
jgi:hypothetical protein